MINVHWVILGAAIGLLGQFFYARDTVRGVTQPNRVTWLLWGIAPLLAFAVELHEGVGLRSLMTFVVGFGPLVIFGLSFVNSNAFWKIMRLDYVCGVLSVAGTAAWLLTRRGDVALAAAILADALAAVPTLVKSWRAPQTESAGAYWGAFVNAVITLLTITTFTAAEVAFPAYISCIALVEVAFVAGRLGPRVRSLRHHGHDAVPVKADGESPDPGRPPDPAP
jgi:hypothetical protein